MARGCRLVRAGKQVDASWRREGDTLVISPAGEPAFALPIEQVGGISGDGFTVLLRLPEGEISLQRLGADGPTLLEELRRDWPVLRAAVLRLAGKERPGDLYAGQILSPAVAGSFRGFFSEGRLLLAPEGGDLTVVFPADLASVGFDEGEYAVRLLGWDGAQTTIGKLGGKSAAFTAHLVGIRGDLARAAGETAAARLPTLTAAGRAGLAERWLPGTLLSFEVLEARAPGFEAAFRASWLSGSPRKAEGERLIQGVSPRDRFLGYTAGRAEEVPCLWLLVREGEAWTLELLSHGDWATYLFTGGEEMPALVEGIVRLPEFSREALYLPLEELTGERSVYAVPARELPFLRELRARYAGRRIHRGTAPQA